MGTMSDLGISDVGKERFASLRARVSTHDRAVKASDASIPRVAEYRARWVAWTALIESTAKDVDNPIVWVPDSTVDLLERQYNTWLTEWENVQTATKLEKLKGQTTTLQDIADKGGAKSDAERATVKQVADDYKRGTPVDVVASDASKIGTPPTPSDAKVPTSSPLLYVGGAVLAVILTALAVRR